MFEVVTREMRLRNYSHKTIKSYLSCLRSFVGYIRPRHPRDMTNENIREFLLHLIQHRGQSASTVNQALNALRFLYVELYKTPMVLGEIPRPKKERKLPSILNLGEVRKIFDVPTNPKHKVMLMVAYSAGLRVGELVRLRWEDLNEERKMIHIHSGKGGKDRFTILSDVIVKMLSDYWHLYQPRNWLFEGLKAGKQYSIRSAEKVFENTARAAGITKKVSIHSLRHAFATHLLEQGTDIRYIQELLDHQSVKTTEIYTHVSRRIVAQLRSPIDDLMKL